MADTVIGAKLTLDANDGINSMKEFKAQLKEAKGDLIEMAKKFGETSNEARMAAKKVAELEDALGDAKKLSDSFNPDKKFVALSQALNGVLGGFTALTGAMGLLGVESEDVQKQLLKVQSAMAFSQGLNQLGDSIDSMKSFGRTIVKTLGKEGAIGLAIAGVAALGYAIWSTTQRTDELSNSEVEFRKEVVKATKEIRELKHNLKLAEDGVISKKDALDQYNKTLGLVTGSTNDLNTAERLTAENASAYIKMQGLKAQANYLLNKSAEASAELELKRAQALDPRASGQLRAELFRQMKEDAASVKVMEDAIDNIDAKLKSIKFTTTTTGLGAGIGAGGKAEKEVKEQKEKEKKEELKNFDTDLSKKLEMLDRFNKNVRNNKLIFLEEQQKDDDAELKRQQDDFDYQYQAWKDLQERKKEVAVVNTQATADALTALGNLFGEQTAAGKVLAIAGATINTYLGATKALAMGGFAGIAQAIVVVASGLAQVKKIISVKVPKDKGSSVSVSSGTSVQAPIQPRPQSTNTFLNQQQLNQMGNAAVRAFVVEHDVTNNQERIRRLNRAARL